jgi:hypothetical protein
MDCFPSLKFNRKIELTSFGVNFKYVKNQTSVAEKSAKRCLGC